MPDITLATITKHPKLLAAVLAFSEREHNDENIRFYCAQGEPKALYERFVSKNAHTMVNLPAEIADPMHTLADQNDWQNPAWKKYLEDAKESIQRLWSKDPKIRFLKSPEFKAVAAAAAGAAAASTVLATQKTAAAAVSAQPTSAAPAKLASAAAQAASAAGQQQIPVVEVTKADPKKAAKLLGITNPKSIALLTKANDLSFNGDKAAALKVFDQIIENENLKTTPEMFMKELQKAAKNQKVQNLKGKA